MIFNVLKFINLSPKEMWITEGGIKSLTNIEYMNDILTIP